MGPALTATAEAWAGQQVIIGAKASWTAGTETGTVAIYGAA